ncbi:TIGR04086 family membrane protein, partial [Bacteroides sp. OttesenSCG-928-J23]|nr:TIGR04086 family membrane protein [Bacteroides sp. OttesenSCG-928-J23]
QINAGDSVKPVLLSVALGVLVCTALLLLLSLVLSTQNVPQSMVSPMAIFAVSAGGFAAGFGCAKMLRNKGLACGAVCGAVLSVVVLLASFSLPENTFGALALLKIAFIMLSAMLGGVMGVNTKSRRRK